MNLLHDLRYAWRTTRRSPVFAVVAIVTLAVGIGVNSAIFSIVDGVLLQPLPYPDPERLVMLWSRSDAGGVREERSAYGHYADWRDHGRSFEALAAYDPASATLSGGGLAEQISVARVSASFFGVLGVPPRLGRAFTAREDAAGEAVALLSHGLWQRRFGGAADALGALVEVDGRRSRVIGVMPPGFGFPDDETDLWEPHTRVPDFEADRDRRGGFGPWFVVGRLGEGATVRSARAEMATLAASSAESEGVTAAVVPLAEQVAGQPVRAGLHVLAGAVVLVLLIACTNVANLLLARASAREREMAVRTALGASRGRLAGQLLAESALLSVLAGVAGLLVAGLLIDAAVAWGPSDVPRLTEVRLDGRALAFTLGLSLMVGLVFGTAPAWRAVRSDPGTALKEGGRGGSSGRRDRRTGAALVVAEFALAVVLASGAGLLVQSLLRVQSVDPGFRSADVLTAQLAVPRQRTPAERVAFCRDAVAAVEALPGVVAAGAVNDFFVPGRPDQAVFVESAGSEPTRFVAPVTSEAVCGDYFASVDLPLLAGRVFDALDTAEGRPVAVINAAMAARFWPGVDPVGRRFTRAGGAAVARPPSQAQWIEVVGVVGDARRQSLERQPVPQIYRPHAQDPSRLMTLLVRAEGDAAALTPAIRERLAAIDPDVPLYHAATLADRLQDQTAGRRFQTALLGLFSLLALALAAGGIYGVMHHLVSRRVHEIGVRMAVGASRGAVLRLVLGRGLGLAALGVSLGVVGAVWLGGALDALLFEVEAGDPATLGLSAALLVAVALLACYLPARRATRIDPLTALRQE